MSNYIETIRNIDGKTFPPVPKSRINELRNVLRFSEELETLYLQTNGIFHEVFTILPISDNRFPKTSWDSIERANNISLSKFSVPKDMLKDFVIFAQLQGMTCAMMAKDDGAIWYEDAQGFHRTNLDLNDFLITASNELDE